MERITGRGYKGLILVLAAWLTMALAGCGGSGGSGSSAVGTFTGATDFPDAIMGGNFNTSSSARWQVLYGPNGIKGAGYITGIAIKYFASSPDVTCPNLTIKMSHSSLTDLSNTFANNLNTGQGGQTTVLNNKSVTFAAGAAGTWHSIPLTTPFEYNGHDDLIIDFARTSPCTDFVQDSGPSSTNANLLAAASSGSATGTTFMDSLNMRFTFQGGDDQVMYNTTSFGGAPFSQIAGYHHVQALYPASDLNGSGPITGIALINTSATTSEAHYTVTVGLAQSNLTALTATFANNYSGTLTTLAKNVPFTVPAGTPAGGAMWLPLSGSFDYNGSDNLLLDIQVTSADAGIGLTNGSASSSRLYGAVGDTSGTLVDGAFEAEFRFNGGPIHVLTAGTGNNNTAFNGTKAAAMLYRASDLGTAGNITSVACRLYADSTAADYANFKVVMGNATAGSLSGSPSSDFVSQNTVFSGTVSIPAGLHAGDWVTIPLTTPFAYDGKSDVIVWMGNDGSGAGTTTVNDCQGESNASRFTGRLGVAAAGVGASSYTVLNWGTDLRMEISR